MVSKLLLPLVIVFLPCIECALAMPAPVSQWDFDDSTHLERATFGTDLEVVGAHSSVPGVREGDGAARLAIGTHYLCTHGIGPYDRTHEYSLLIDFKVDRIGWWYPMLQTQPDNRDDADCFIQEVDGKIGSDTSGYSESSVVAGRWNRLVITTRLQDKVYDIYLDGEKILTGIPGDPNRQAALYPQVLLFADDDEDGNPIEVSRIAFYSGLLSPEEVRALGGAGSTEPNNTPPSAPKSSEQAPVISAGEVFKLNLKAEDPDSDGVRFRVDWGDGLVTHWTDLTTAGAVQSVTHIWKYAGQYPVSVLAMDEHGELSQLGQVTVVKVKGPNKGEYITEPFLQNLKLDGITIMFELDARVSCSVGFGRTETQNATVDCTVAPSGFNTFIYKAVLPDLVESSDYHYRITRGGEPDEKLRSFRTGTDDPIDFAFSVWSDSQGENRGAYPPDKYEPTKAMMRHMRDDPEIHFGTNSGDLAENGSSYSDTRNYYLDRVAKYLGQDKPWFSGWGNHEPGRNAVMRKFADMPSKDRTDLIDGRKPTPGWGSYSFEYAGCHFIMIDDDTRNLDVLLWLEQDLETAAAKNPRFTFLYVHRPPFCEVWIDGDSFYRSNLVPVMENPLMRSKVNELVTDNNAGAQLQTLMEKYRVDVCFSGHMHGYQRGFLNGVFYCVTGGGSWLDLTEPLSVDWPHMTVGGFHPLAIDVTPLGLGGENGMINEYVKISVKDDKWEATSLGFRPNGDFFGIIDRFSSDSPPTN